MDSKSERTVITMPSISQLLSLLDPMHALALEGAIEHHSKEYQSKVKARAIANAPSQFVAFAIPLDSYLPLPHAYASTVHVPDQQGASMTIVQQTPLDVQLGRKKLRAVLTVLVVAIADAGTSKPLKDFDEKTILRLYREAIRLANHTLLAYKLTPHRHNHDLRTVTIADRPSYVDMIRFDSISGRILECGNVHMHHNLVASVEDARVMSQSEYAALTYSFEALGEQSDSPSTGILVTIYQAADQVCLGNYTQALVLADTYTEHLMRYCLLCIHFCNGMSESSATEELDKLRTMERLIKGLAGSLGVSPRDMKLAIGFSQWLDACRYPRNQITHKFTKTVLEPHEARAALRETIHMTSKLIDLIIARYPQIRPVLQLFKTPNWYLGFLEDENNIDGQALTTVGEIHEHVYYATPDDYPVPNQARGSAKA